MHTTNFKHHAILVPFSEEGQSIIDSIPQLNKTSSNYRAATTNPAYEGRYYLVILDEDDGQVLFTTLLTEERLQEKIANKELYVSSKDPVNIVN